MSAAAAVATNSTRTDASAINGTLTLSPNHNSMECAHPRTPRKFIKNICVYCVCVCVLCRKIYGGISIKYLYFDVLRHEFFPFINALIKVAFINLS